MPTQSVWNKYNLSVAIRTILKSDQLLIAIVASTVLMRLGELLDLSCVCIAYLY